MQRTAKQLLYAIVFLGIIALLVYGGYRLFGPGAGTCTDHIQNQDETGIDCGGVCATSCTLPADLEPLTVTGVTQILKIPGTKATSIMGTVQNPNPSYAARTFGYVFSLYDQRGVLLQSFRGTSFIYSSEVKTLAVPNVVITSAATPARAELSVGNPDWVLAARLPRSELLLQNQITETKNNLIQVRGSVLNNDPGKVSRVNLIAMFYGNGVLLGVSQTELENLSPNESRAFAIVHPALTGLDPRATKILLYGAR